MTHGDEITVNCTDNYEVGVISCQPSEGMTPLSAITLVMVKLLPFALFYTKLILFCLIDQVNRVGEPIQCHNGTWTQIPRCVPARCKTMPTPPQNGMIVAPSLNHGASGLYHCKVLSIVFDAARIKSLLHLHSLPRLDFFCLPVTQTTSLKSCNSRNQKHTHYNSRMDTS